MREGSAGRPLSESDREIVQTLIDTGAVNFEAIGRTIAQVGPKLVDLDDDGWIRWCGSDLRIFRWPQPHLELERVSVLNEIAQAVRAAATGRQQ